MPATQPDPNFRSRHDADQLAEAYTPGVRRLEVSAVIIFILAQIALAVRLAPHLRDRWWMMLPLLVVALIAADFVSGLFHWAGDTWGSPNTPLVGRAFVRTFRHHHVDPEAITRHDFFEVNGGNSLISLPVLAGAHLLPIEKGEVGWATFIGAFLAWIFCTNQFHKWSHQADRPRWVRALQRAHLILPVAHHDIHHTPPYTTHYCITVGWLNEPLRRIRFFRRLERVVTALTGAVPRKDELGAGVEVPPG